MKFEAIKRLCRSPRPNLPSSGSSRTASVISLNATRKRSYQKSRFESVGNPVGTKMAAGSPSSRMIHQATSYQPLTAEDEEGCSLPG